MRMHGAAAAFARLKLREFGVFGFFFFRGSGGCSPFYLDDVRKRNQARA